MAKISNADQCRAIEREVKAELWHRRHNPARGYRPPESFEEFQRMGYAHRAVTAELYPELYTMFVNKERNH